MEISTQLKSFERDMKLKNLAESTISSYLSQVDKFLIHFKEKDSPKHINENEIKDYLLLSKEVNSQKSMHSAIKKYYTLTVNQPLKMKYIPYPESQSRLPVIFTVKEMTRMFEVATNLKHKAVLAVLYSTGCRRDELLNLKWEHIHRNKNDNSGYIHIHQGKGAKDRIVPLDPSLSLLLIEYYKEYQPEEYIFEGQYGGKYSATSVFKVVKNICKKAGISKRMHPHLIRHTYATHQLENGLGINYLQEFLGHKNPETTQIYTHVSNAFISNFKSPLSKIA